MFSTSISVYGQNESGSVDSTFENYMQNAWNEIRDSDYSESLQNKYSKEFYDYYKGHPDTKTGSIAIRNAFVLWANTGNSDYFKDVIESLDDDSEIWKLILSPLRGIYRNNNDLEEHEHIELLQYLSAQITEPIGKSEAILILLRLSEKKLNINEEIELALQLIETNATEYHLSQGFEYLKEFLSLNIGRKWPDTYLLSGLNDFMTGYNLKNDFITGITIDIGSDPLFTEKSPDLFSRYRWQLAAGGILLGGSALLMLISSDDNGPPTIPLPPGRP